MNFNKHSDLEGQHAFLSASNYHWINYDNEKLRRVYLKRLAAQRGTELHEYAKRSIELGIKLPDTKATLNMYVNDAIGFKMKPEVVLYYSPYSFGTVDAISFNDNFLRIHDFKSGEHTCSFVQLEIYASYFCLEYKVDPKTIKIELRIYQNNEIKVLLPETNRILYLMQKIKDNTLILAELSEAL